MPFWGSTPREFTRRLRWIYSLYAVGFLLLVALLAAVEMAGMPRHWLGYIFLLVTVSLYAGIGIVCRTSDQAEYYVAGRRVPAFYNGMATAADWMSVASFIGVAGTLYLSGYGGLAYIIGWTGGFVLVALLLAPYLRKFGQYTIPDFLGARYGGHLPRMAGVVCALLCSFTYLVAQIYGVGIVTTRLTGISFELGIFVALGGMLLCSFLGGMRAVTWTQVGQYIILVIAYLVPVIWLAVKHTGTPLPQLAGSALVQTVNENERRVLAEPGEIEVRQLWAERAQEMQARIQGLPHSWTEEKQALRARLAWMNATNAPLVEIRSLERELATYPASIEEARTVWSKAQALYAARAAPALPHTEPFPSEDAGERSNMRINFLAMAICLMLGTAGMPHILMRSYTTPSVADARRSVTWSLLFILLLYLMAPVLALLVKYEIYAQVVGMEFSDLPAWIHAWSGTDSSLLEVADVNHDGVLQASEIHLGAEMVVLAMPEIGGLPFVISGLVAAGGLAAALSTADGLLLTLSNSLSHDMWYRVVSPRMSAARRVMVSKILLLLVAFGAAWLAARKPADILFMVSAAFSFAASSFFPALVMGIFWRRANKWGATLGMAAGLLTTFAYMAHTHPWLREWVFGVSQAEPVQLWWGIQPIAAGVFGAPAAFVTIIVVSLLTPRPDRATLALVDYLRQPEGR